MQFMVDECTGPAVAQWLRDQGYDVYSIFEQSRGMNDDDIVEKAYAENRLLITNDKDFGEKIFRDKKPHKGIILLRLDDERAKSKILVLKRLIENYSDKLNHNFVVATEKRIRIAEK